MSALWPLQTALWARLSADAGVKAALAGGVYEGTAPEGAALPYGVIGEATEVPAGTTFGRAGWSPTVTLHVWAVSRMEALAALTAIDAALTLSLALDEHTTARARREMTDVLVEEDGDAVIYHVPARYRIQTWETV